ncbi:predicted protein [Uncinocarpus reesii 1704]|uniref:Uncharacterized protein n=1 Tax=Uncinocarpus reesii (strain UAMH 1704) TaxID=336963 RepID=C4JS59_UNCRE|nr:uncharacterized protein UREG_05298 [Uncinocarpus reesii 1704]EEP80456.1 predicted protein [Uncinocarpus reesii 1704]
MTVRIRPCFLAIPAVGQAEEPVWDPSRTSPKRAPSPQSQRRGRLVEPMAVPRGSPLYHMVTESAAHILLIRMGEETYVKSGTPPPLFTLHSALCRWHPDLVEITLVPRAQKNPHGRQVVILPTQRIQRRRSLHTSTNVLGFTDSQ